VLLDRKAGEAMNAPVSIQSSPSRLIERLRERGSPLKQLGWLVAAVVVLVILPAEGERVRNASAEAVALAHWYAREHVVLCLIPALFIAGAVGVFVRQSAVMRFLGPDAPKSAAYGVASVSGAILSVCSCTILPLFAGIWRMGAGLGPAIAFLFSGPAINILAIVLTARVLGLELGIVRGVGAVVFSIVIGLLMARIFRQDRDATMASHQPEVDVDAEPLAPGVVLLALLMVILVFANWSSAASTGVFGVIASVKWWLVGGAAVLMGLVLQRHYAVGAGWLVATALATGASALLVPQHPEVPFVVGTVGLALSLLSAGEKATQWLDATWEFTRLIVPLLLAGVFVAGFLLGRPGHEGLIPTAWVEQSVGGSSLGATFVASIAGAFMYFATLTEVPILQGLIGSGMGKGPALALLLAGPALSLPSMLALRQIMGTRKTVVYVALTVVMATLVGYAYGQVWGD
jgi:uncharacterized membrane protein YraQ (UPF0718 family)